MWSRNEPCSYLAEELTGKRIKRHKDLEMGRGSTFEWNMKLNCGCGSWEEMSRGVVKQMWAEPVATAHYNEHLEFFLMSLF